jgi:hypothetical protein
MSTLYERIRAQMYANEVLAKLAFKDERAAYAYRHMLTEASLEALYEELNRLKAILEPKRKGPGG